MLTAPYPYYGGKSRVASVVWQRLGDVPNYVEPFFGSGAVLLARPSKPRLETINDACGFVANFWRAISADPEQVALWADWPINENDLHARHAWLLQQEDFAPRLEGDPDFYDAKVAGWWVWGLCSWIGSGWCSGKGPWWPDEAGCLRDRRVTSSEPSESPHLGGGGRGVNRQLPHLGGGGPLAEWFGRLQDRLRFVRVACGDWTRVLGPSITVKHGLTGVFLDPPYAIDQREEVYRQDQAVNVLPWCLEHGENPLLRIALCGYEGEYDLPGWSVYAWKAAGGYGSQGEGRGRDNAHRERIWFSPHCLGAAQQGSLF